MLGVIVTTNSMRFKLPCFELKENFVRINKYKPNTKKGSIMNTIRNNMLTFSLMISMISGQTIDIETIQTSIYNLINPELNIVNNELLVVTGPFYVNYQSDCLGGDCGEDGDCDDTGEEPQFFPERGGIKEMFGNIIYLYVEGSGTAVLRWFDMGNSVETG